MWTIHLNEFDEVVLMLLRDPSPLPPEDLVGIVRHYLTEPVPPKGHVDLLLFALSRPEFDNAHFDDVRAARADRLLQMRGARLAGLAVRPDADCAALVRKERSLTAQLVAAELTLSPDLLAELAAAGPTKLLLAALANPHHPEEVDLATIDLLEQPHGYLSSNVHSMLQRTPAVEERVRASENSGLRWLAWEWCDTAEDRLAFATFEVAAAVAAGDADGLIDDILRSDEAAQLPSLLLQQLEGVVDAALTAHAADDSFLAVWRRNDEQKRLDQVRRILSAQADEPHPPVAVLFDRVLHAEWGEPTEQAERRLLAAARTLLGHGADFWPALADTFDADASVPDLVSLALLVTGASDRAMAV